MAIYTNLVNALNLYQSMLDLATAVATDVNTLYSGQGTLSNLGTNTKTSLVAAINEVVTRVNTLQSQVDALGQPFDNNVSNSTTKGWTSSKIVSYLNSAITTAKQDILGGVPPTTLDTIKELADALANDEVLVNQVIASLATKVSFTDNQSLTETQKTTARTNIGAASQSLLATISDQVSSNISSIVSLSSSLTSNVSTLSNSVSSALASATAATTAITSLSSGLNLSYAEMSTNIGILSTIIGTPINIKDAYLTARGLLQPQTP